MAKSILVTSQLLWLLFVASAARGQDDPGDDKEPARALPVVAQTEAGMNAAALAKIGERMKSAIGKEGAGFVTLIARNGKIVHFEATGYADLAAKTPMTKDAIFAIASMSKPITALLLMILVDEKKVALDDPVAKYIPEFKDLTLKDGTKPRQPMTVRQVLTHTCGFGGDQNIIGNLEETAKALAKRPLNFEPGTKWGYSPGLNVVGRIVEVVSGRPFDEFFAERLTRPLGMVDTGFCLSPEQRKRVPKFYQPTADKQGIEAVEHPIWKEPQPNPSYGLFSTAGDQARFYQMILNGGELDGRRILSTESVAEMIKLQTGDFTTGFTPGNGFGLGFGLIRKPQGVTQSLSPGSFGHGGAWGTIAWADRRRQMIFILLCQRDRVGFGSIDASELRGALHDLAVGAIVADDPPLKKEPEKPANVPTDKAAAPGAKGATYYVSVNGNDAHAGSEARPWRTLTHALSRMQSGDEVQVMNGTYDEAPHGSVSVAKSRVTIRNHPGHAPWFQLSGNPQFSFAIQRRADGVTVEGLRISRRGPEDTDWRIVGIVTIGANHCTVRNCKIYYETTPKNQTGDCIKFTGGVGGTDAGANHNLIEGCEIWHAAEEAVDGVGDSFNTVRRCIIRDSRNGVVLKGGCTGIVIEDNVFYNFVYAAILLGGHASTDYLNSDYPHSQIEKSVVRRNLISYADSKTATGIGLVGAVHCEVYNNTVYGAGLRVMPAEVYNKRPGGRLELHVLQHCSNNTVANNIFGSKAPSGIVRVDKDNGKGLVLRNNCYHALPEANFFHVDGTWLDYPQFRRLGLDFDSVYADPQLLNPSADPPIDRTKFGLATASPCIDAGTNLPPVRGNIPHVGRAPDIGAFESNGESREPPTADDLSNLINRLFELDSIDLAKEVKFRPGLEPPLHAVDADESAMKVLPDPYEVQGRNQPGAAGWYRVSFTVRSLATSPFPKRATTWGWKATCGHRAARAARYHDSGLFHFQPGEG